MGKYVSVSVKISEPPKLFFSVEWLKSVMDFEDSSEKLIDFLRCFSLDFSKEILQKLQIKYTEIGDDFGVNVVRNLREKLKEFPEEFYQNKK